jgi:hypothetical protein
MQRLGAVAARAHGDAGAVEQRGEVVRMRGVEREGEDAAAVLRAAEQRQPLDLRQRAMAWSTSARSCASIAPMPMAVT